MDWRDDAVLLSLKPHGESSALVSLFTAAHGRHKGLVRAARSKRLRGVLMPGNRLQVTWRARLEEHLGTVAVELEDALAARLLDDPGRLAAMASACALIDRGMAEREPHPALYLATVALMHDLTGADWGAAYVRWELALLGELGYGLDLGACAATGARTDLVYVSPKSARAVSRAAGAPYAAKLLALPGFLAEGGSAGPGDVAAGLALTGFFLDRCFGELFAKPLPDARARLAARLGSV